MADREVDDALARSFLARLPAEVVASLRAEGERADYPAGTPGLVMCFLDSVRPNPCHLFASRQAMQEPRKHLRQ